MCHYSLAFKTASHTQKHWTSLFWKNSFFFMYQNLDIESLSYVISNTYSLKDSFSSPSSWYYSLVIQFLLLTLIPMTILKKLFSPIHTVKSRYNISVGINSSFILVKARDSFIYVPSIKLNYQRQTKYIKFILWLCVLIAYTFNLNI